MEIKPVLFEIILPGVSFVKFRIKPSTILLELEYGLEGIRASLPTSLTSYLVVTLWTPISAAESEKLTSYDLVSSANSSPAIFILAEPVPEPSVTLLKSLSVPPLMYPAGLVVGITAAVLIDVPTTVPAPLNSTLNVFSCGSILLL
jgi:hypothetical protein